MNIVEYGIKQLIATALGHTRIYPLRAPQNATTPFIIYQRTSAERWQGINRTSDIAQANIQIDVYADTYNSAKEISGQIQELLASYRGVVYYGTDSPQEFVSIKGVSVQSDFDTLDQTEEPFLYRNSTDYLTTYGQ